MKLIAVSAVVSILLVFLAERFPFRLTIKPRITELYISTKDAAHLGDIHQSVELKFQRSYQQDSIDSSEYSNSNSKLVKVAILGERNSGTNLIEQLVLRNVQTDKIHVQPGITQIKHYIQPWTGPDFQKDLSQTLIIVAVRNAYDWLNSMHSTCYCCEAVSAAYTTMEQFLTVPFNTTPINPHNFQPRPDDLCPLDINPYKNNPHFDNILHARYEKMLHFMNLSQLAGAFEVIQHERLLEPEGQIDWFTEVARKWNLPLQKESISPIIGDARPWKQTTEPSYYNAQNRINRSVYLNRKLLETDEESRKMCEVKNKYLNEYMEQLMGYQLIDCHHNDNKQE